MDVFEFADGTAESPADARDEVRKKLNSRARKVLTYTRLAVGPQ